MIRRRAGIAATGILLCTALSACGDSAESAVMQNARSLTAEELQIFTDYVNEADNRENLMMEYHTYDFEHSSRDSMLFACIDGSTADEKTFTLRLTPKTFFGGGELNGYHVTDCEAVLQMKGEGYQLISNRMLYEEGQIADQTFEVNLSPWGKVTFVTYEPDFDRNPYCDVTFSILQDGECVTNLVGMDAENMLAAAECFDSVAAVSFPDYNEDGCTDVIAIINYSYIQGMDAGTGYTQARIYTGHAEKDFTLERELSQAARTALGDEMTVADVLQYAREHGAKYGVSDDEETFNDGQ